MDALKKKKIISGTAVLISAFFANAWAFWGIIENFHEGWYFRRFWDNVLLMFGQYLLMPIWFMLLAYVSIKWNKIGSALHLLLAAGAYLLFGKMNAGFFFVVIPLIALAILYWVNSLKRKRLAYFLVLGLPLIQIVGIGTYFSIRILNRHDDGNYTARQIKGNGVELIWAPQGPGWPDTGTSWYRAKEICSHLSADGQTLSDSVRNFWRLPTVDEAVRSQVYHGQNAGGIWNVKTHSAFYNTQPDKESPLWNMYAKTIYWWTADEVSTRDAYIVVYNGTVWPRNKKYYMDYLNFRAVKEVKQIN